MTNNKFPLYGSKKLFFEIGHNISDDKLHDVLDKYGRCEISRDGLVVTVNYKDERDADDALRAVNWPSLTKQKEWKGYVFAMGLPVTTTDEELEKIFTKFGKAEFGRFRDTATIFYEDKRDAEDAVRDLGGAKINGSAIRITLIMW